MADQPGALGGIKWDESFPFTRIFKTFRMAIQPSKLGLALAGILLMGLLGSILDGLWPASRQPVGQEIWAYWQRPDIGAWRSSQQSDRLAALRREYGPGGLLKSDKPDDESLGKPRAVDRALKQLHTQFRKDSAEISDSKDLPEDKKKTAVAALAQEYARVRDELDAYRTRGIFESFMTYEQHAIGHFLDQARQVLLLDFWSVARGTNEVIGARYHTVALRRGYDFGDIGMIGTLLLILRGWQWMATQHPVYLVLFGLGSLAVWSLFGGAICRMAALNAARDETISPRAALNFASRKFMAFFSAPLLPMLMAVVIGLMLWAGGFFILQIPYVGDLIGGPLMILALLGGFVIALILVGGVGGSSLMWPTIGVEGTDGFDAVSRSYNYFYSRPWRLTFYAVVASAYAGVTYIALRYFVYILLRVTRFFVAAGAGVKTSRPGAGSPWATKLDAIWPLPRPNNLLGDWNSTAFARTGWGDGFAAAFIHVYVFLLVLALCAFLASFFFCAGTIIYTLLRHKVDSVDYDDVFVEEDETAAPALAGSPPVAADLAVAGAGSPSAPGAPPEAPGTAPA